MRIETKKSFKPVALVTGGSSFLGGFISRKLALEGFDLVLHYQSSRVKAMELGIELRSLGARVILLQADLRNVQKSPSIIKRAIQNYKRLDLLINNASVFYPTPLGNTGYIPLLNLFKVNLFSPYYLSQAAYPWLKKSGGNIVNLTDIYGENPILGGYSAYCASKSGLMTLTRYLAKEWGPKIRVNAVSPGAVYISKTFNQRKRRQLIDRSALKRQGTPMDIANAVFFLATQPFITGQVLKVDGGRFI